VTDVRLLAVTQRLRQHAVSPPQARAIASTVSSLGKRLPVSASCNVLRAQPVRRASSR
jgi:hypothetical protein